MACWLVPDRDCWFMLSPTGSCPKTPIFPVEQTSVGKSPGPSGGVFWDWDFCGNTGQDYTCEGAGLGIVSPEAFGSTDEECCARRKCEVRNAAKGSERKSERIWKDLKGSERI